MSAPKTLQVLEEGSQFSVASVSGVKDPVVLLDSKLLWSLKESWRHAKDEALALQPTRNVGSILQLCETLGRILEMYEGTRNKYYGGPSWEVERLEIAQIEHELAELRKSLGID